MDLPQSIDPPPGRHIVQRIQHQGKLADVRHVEGGGVAHVAVQRLVLHPPSRGHGPSHLGGDRAFRLPHVARPKQKLAIEIGNIDRVEIDDGDPGESGEGEVLEQFAPDAAGADEEDAGRCYGGGEGGSEGDGQAGEEGMGGGSSRSCPCFCFARWRRRGGGGGVRHGRLCSGTIWHEMCWTKNEGSGDGRRAGLAAARKIAYRSRPSTVDRPQLSEPLIFLHPPLL